MIVCFLACHLSREERVEQTLSFTKQYESLSKYDTVRIEVRDEAGRTLAIVYQGKVDTLGEIQNLSVPGWDGGPLTIVISGYQAGRSDPIYQEAKKYDGINPTTVTQVLIHPNPGLASGNLVLQLTEGQSLPLPQVDVSPPNLAEPNLEWLSSNPQVVQVIGGRLTAGTVGSALLTASLAAYPAKTLVFEVRVQTDPRVPVSLSLDRDTLYLAENGAPQAFGLQIMPATASGEVVWTLEDSSLAALRSDGSFQGLKPGVTRATAASKLKTSIKAVGFIAVSEPVPVSSVRFAKENATLFVNGAPEILAVEVLPARANPAVDFTLSDSSKASLRGDTLRPLAEGAVRVFVRSREDTAKADTLEVVIEAPVPVAQVEASDSALTLYVRGEARTVSARVLPAHAPQGVRWTSLSPAIAAVGPATGALQGLKPGLALVVAVSQADSSRKDTVLVSVKVDAPLLEVGRDTTVSSGQTVTFLPTVTQEYGQVVHYKWDFDGDLQWDDSAAALTPKSFRYEAPKEYAARFYVRDTEGNETVKSRRVTVVSSATVAITAPPDNSHTNQKVIPVTWSVNGKVQDTLTSQTLSVLGANVITRTARDSAGKAVTHSITVHYDTTAPFKPVLTGTTPTNVKPRWTWSSGGGGSGEYRIRLGDDAFPSGASTTRDTVHTLAADPVSGTAYTLFVQERDLAGNWSPSASLAIVHNVTQPVVVIQTPRASGTHYSAAAAVALSGTASGPVAISKVTYKVGSAPAANATLASAAWSTPALALQEGAATLVTITATDVAGNAGEATLTLFHDNTAPSAPTFTSGPTGNLSVLKGTFAWSAGNDGVSGSGLNGRYRYNLNNGPWKDTAATLLTDLALPEGNVVLSVQEQDRALNWSPSATRVFKADITPPTLTLTSHANPYASTALSITLAGQVRDSISGVASMTVAGQASGSGTVTVNATGSWTTAELTLVPGANTLVLTALDQAGNSRILNAVVNVSIPAPIVIITSPPNNHLTQKDTVVVQYTLNGAAGNRSFTLAEGSNSLVVESPPNGSGVTGRDTVVVIRDATRPNAPALTASTSPTRGTATWTWVSGNDNAGGAGMRSPAAFQYRVNGGTWTTPSPASATTLSITTEGTHAVEVQEQDRAGNWSLPSASKTIVVDKTGPKVVILTRNNYPTNTSPLSVRYTVDDVEATPSACALSAAATTCSVTASDALGNPTTASITVRYLPNTIFLTPNGTGDGSSWDRSSGNLAGILADQRVLGKDLWLGTGSYRGGFFTGRRNNILGGFDAAAYPYTTASRNKTGTSLDHLQTDTNLDPINIDGIVISSLVVRFGVVNMTDATFIPVDNAEIAIRVIDDATLNATNLFIANRSYPTGVVEVWGSRMNINGGSVVRNSTSQNRALSISGFGSSVHLSGGFNLYGNTNPNLSGQASLGENTELIVDPGVVFNCDNDLVNEGGTATCNN